MNDPAASPPGVGILISGSGSNMVALVELGGRPGRLFGIVTPFYLFKIDHMRFSRSREVPLGNWDVFLNVLNVETENGLRI